MSPTTALPLPTAPEAAALRLSTPVGTLQGSAILRIAAEIRERIAAGEAVCNLTVGDFDPRQFRIPKELEDGIVDAVRQGQTNYPPATGVPEFKASVLEYTKRSLGLSYADNNVLVTSGSRPAVYGTYATLCDPGDRVIYGVPSWNNDYYCHMVGALGVPVSGARANGFHPSAEDLAPHLPGARMLALNSTHNPCGTCYTAEALGEICDLVLAENKRRGPHERPLYVLYDQVYWQLIFGDRSHVDPVGLRPEMAPFTIYIDGMSKAFAATGVRVGWALGPSDIMRAMNNFLAHVGTWAPRAEQYASARLLMNQGAIDAYRETIIAGAQGRLQALYNGIQSFRAEGHAVDAVEPQGAIYLSGHFALLGKRTADGEMLTTNDDIRRWLLSTAGLGVVPFDAFGAEGDTGWCRLSVGAVSMADIENALPRLHAGLRKLS